MNLFISIVIFFFIIKGKWITKISFRLAQSFSTGEDFVLWRTFGKVTTGGWRTILASSRQKPKMLLNIPQHTGQLPKKELSSPKCQ